MSGSSSDKWGRRKRDSSGAADDATGEDGAAPAEDSSAPAGGPGDLASNPLADAPAESQEEAPPRRRSDKGFTEGLNIDLMGLDRADIEDDLRGHALHAPASDGEVRIFGKYSHKEIEELLAWSGVYDAVRDKGYKDIRLELNYLSDLDQRIFLKEGDEVLVHIRLKLSYFRFRLHPGAPRIKLMYIDWLMTRHPRTTAFRPERLFPGQDDPGLGVFNQLSDFITNLSIGVGARGAFNIPEYFHDAMLFHRRFNFYDPIREAFFRGVLRDLRRFGAREISHAFSESRILNQHGEVVSWQPGEMITMLSPDLEEMIWNQEYYTRVIRELKRVRFQLIPKSDAK